MSKLLAGRTLINSAKNQLEPLLMKSTAFVLCMAAALAAHAQTAAKPAAPAARPATTAAKTAGATHTAAPTASAVKYPAGVSPLPGVPTTAFSLRYQDIKAGTGAEAVPMKMYKVKYTGWRAADGVIFDAWDKHPQPVLDAEGKPETGPDGKPKMGEPQPASFPVGMGRMIPGFDQGFNGMRVGGKRRLFIPWQLAYGSRAIPDQGTDHPGIPPKSNLVFDVELVEMDDLPMPPSHPAMPGAPPAPRPAPSAPGAAPSAGAPPAPSTPPAPSQPATPPPPSH
jgi:peptidylprolyl isomerase